MLIKTIDDMYRYIGCRYEFHENNFGGDCIGSFYMRKCRDHMEIWNFSIDLDYRGQGLGQKMMQEAIAIANGRKLTLFVERDNDVAIHVYEKCGFRITGCNEATGIYKAVVGDAWTMTHMGENNNRMLYTHGIDRNVFRKIVHFVTRGADLMCG